MNAKVLVRFNGLKEGRIFEAGETFEGSSERIEELVKKGFIEAPKKAPKKEAPKEVQKEAPKAKASKKEED